MPFEFKQTDIREVVEVTAKSFSDERGYFAELFKGSAFREGGLDIDIVQVNHSHSERNVLRGLHYQMNPKAQGKLVGVMHGEVFDVAVDIREGSPTYGQWVGAMLSAEKKNLLWVPKGFAHGYFTVSDEADVLYFVDEEYAPETERGIIWNDIDLAIEWPSEDVLLSERDQEFGELSEGENNFKYKDLDSGSSPE